MKSWLDPPVVLDLSFRHLPPNATSQTKSKFHFLPVENENRYQSYQWFQRHPWYDINFLEMRLSTQYFEIAGSPSVILNLHWICLFALMTVLALSEWTADGSPLLVTNRLRACKKELAASLVINSRCTALTVKHTKMHTFE